jgi:hypothetical protein
VQLLDLPNVTDIFPSDEVAKAKKYLDAISTTGAYSESNGATVFREEIAAALKVRERSQSHLSAMMDWHNTLNCSALSLRSCRCCHCDGRSLA